MHVAARFGPLFGSWYRHFHTPRPGSLSDLLSTFSRALGGGVTVVQIGANDGLKRDPLHKYIRRDRWRGILVEPQRRVYEEWLAPLHARNPRIQTLNAALGPEDGETELWCVAFSDARWATGLASFDRAHLEGFLDTDHVRREAAREGVAIPAAADARVRAEVVRVISPATLLAQAGLDALDLLFIDTEGFDFEVIKLFDVASTRPRMVVWENDHLSADDAEASAQHLRSAGYRVAHLGPNSCAVREPPAQLASFFGRAR
jgi:FkbM family methyltransferase